MIDYRLFPYNSQCPTNNKLMVNDRIQQIIDSKGFNKNTFSAKIGLSNNVTVGNIVGGRRSSPSYEVLLKIAEAFPDINPGWLLTGNGNMYVQDIKVEEPETVREHQRKVFKLKTDRIYEDQTIPLYNIEASAGIVSLFRDHKDYQPVDYLHIPGLPKCDGSLYVTGDSMYPLLKSGDIVAYKQIHDFQNDIFWGEMYLVSIDVAGEEQVTIKYVQKSEIDGYIKLVSQNKHHQDKDVSLEKIRAMALIKASVRINSMS